MKNVVLCAIYLYLCYFVTLSLEFYFLRLELNLQIPPSFFTNVFLIRHDFWIDFQDNWIYIYSWLEGQI